MVKLFKLTYDPTKHSADSWIYQRSNGQNKRKDDMSKEDNVGPLVLAAIDAIATGRNAEISATSEALGRLNTGDIIGELLAWVRYLTSNVDLNALLAAVTIPLPPRAPDIIAAILDYDMGRIKDAMGGASPQEIFVSLLVLVAALKDARTRI